MTKSADGTVAERVSKACRYRGRNNLKVECSGGSDVDQATLISRTTHEASVAKQVSGMFGRDGLFMVASALQLLSGLFITPILSRVLTPSQFGRFAAEIALYYVLLYSVSLGLNTGLQRVYASQNGEETSRRLLAISVVLIILATSAVLSTGSLWSPLLGFGHFGPAERLTVVWSGLAAVTLVCLALIRSQNRLFTYASLSLLQSVGGLALGTILALQISRTVTDVLWGATSVQAVCACWALLAIPPKWRGSLDWRLGDRALRFSLPLVPQQVGGFVIAAADRFVIQRDLGPGPTGRYQVAYSLGALAINLLAFLNGAWLPRIFSLHDVIARTAVLRHSRDSLYMLLIPVTLGLSVGGPVVLKVWAPASFETSGLTLVSLLVIASTFPVCAALAAERALLPVGRSGVVALGTLAAAFANIVLNLA